MLIAEAPRLAISINSICRNDTCFGRLNDGDNMLEPKNRPITITYTPRKEKKAYFGKCSAIIHAINAGNNVIKTKFLKRRIALRKIMVEKILFHDNVLLSIIIWIL